MDPNANLAEQLRLASRIVEAFDNERTLVDADCARLSELVIALNDWIRGGGFLPSAWEKR